MMGVHETIADQARVFGITERCVDLSGNHMRRVQLQGSMTHAEAVAHIKSLQADPKHEATGYNEEFAYHWARVPAGPGLGDGIVRRWSIMRRH